jgi:hypothetical protein
MSKELNEYTYFIDDVKKYLVELLRISPLIQERTLKNQLSILGKIIDCYKTDQEEKISEIELNIL